jgi:toxin FitB
MDKRYLIDTNIIIYYLDNKIPSNQSDFIESVFKSSFNISTITKIELLGWHKISNDIKAKIESFLRNSKVFYIDSEIENTSIKIK